MNTSLNPLLKKYHSFEEWLSFSEADKQQWYKMQKPQKAQGFTRPVENEALAIEASERRQLELDQYRSTVSEINH